MEMEQADHLDRMLKAPTLAAITGDPEFVAMTALANEISSALGGAWTTATDRTRIWLSATSKPVAHEPSLVGRVTRPMLAHKKSLLAGGAALTVTAAVGWAVMHRRHSHAAA